MNNHFFWWRILNSNDDVIYSGEVVKANINDNFFIVDEENFRVWKGWTCRNVNLLNFAEVGDEICVEFATGDCSIGGPHFSYAYIDGLCGEDMSPIAPEINLNEAYCEDQTVSVTTTGGGGYNQYTWEVCRFVNGSPLQCFYTEPETAYSNIVFDDVLTFFFKDRPPTVSPLACGDRFKVTLRVSNDCGLSASGSKEFTYECENSEIDYLDIVVCSGQQDLPITGTNDCVDCPVIWSPGQYLDNPIIQFPTILGSINTEALDQIYHVAVTNEFGCVYEDEIEVFRKSEIYGEIDLEINFLNFCEEEIIAHVEFDSPISSDDVTVAFEFSGDNPNYYPYNEPMTGDGPKNFSSTTYEGIPISNPGVSTLHSFQVPEIMLRRFDYNVKVTISIGAIPLEAEVYGNCSLAEYFDVPAGPYHGWMTLDVPNAFSPNSPNPENQTLGPYFNGNSNVIAITFDVYYQWGGLAFEGEALTPNLEGPGLTGFEPEIRWDGTIDGEPAETDIYIWLLDYENCDYVFLGCSDFDIWDIDEGDAGDCDDEDHYGDALLFY